MLATAFRMFLAFVASFATAVWTRLTGKRLEARWGFAFELAVGTMRGAVRAFVGVPIEQARALPHARVPLTMRSRVTLQAARLGDRPAEISTPAGWTEGGPVGLYMHGGGYVVCSPGTHRELVARLALATGTRVYSLDYRLAPEHPFPAARDDALAAIDALHSLGIPTGRMWFGGDSAGGGLALSTAVALRDRGDTLPRALVLMSPWVDLAARDGSVLGNDGYDYLVPAILPSYARAYAGGRPLDDPGVSPAYATLDGLPDTLLMSGERELFYDQHATLAERMAAAGVEIEHLVGPGMVHVYPALARFTQRGRRDIDRAGRFVRERLLGQTPPGGATSGP